MIARPILLPAVQKEFDVISVFFGPCQSGLLIISTTRHFSSKRYLIATYWSLIIFFNTIDFNTPPLTKEIVVMSWVTYRDSVVQHTLKMMHRTSIQTIYSEPRQNLAGIG